MTKNVIDVILSFIIEIIILMHIFGDIMKFRELYIQLLNGADPNGYDEHHLDCLLNPERYAPVIAEGNCECDINQAECVKYCLFNAITISDDGKLSVNSKCVGCEECISACKNSNIIATTDTIKVINTIKSGKKVYAMIAPAFLGQFSNEITPDKLRTAFKKLGFTGMLEVSLFADILTLKEAIEFDKHVKNDNDYMLTSCCCPVWIQMIRKIYNDLTVHLPQSVSPMVACGRVIKKLHPDAVTVFIGPCLAKKSEAREVDIADSTDYVLTFQEVKDLFDSIGLRPTELESDNRDHSSRAGRIYAYSGGVSAAVTDTVHRIYGDKNITSVCAEGVPQCKALLDKLIKGEINENFIEGMGCIGGCVGGKKSLISAVDGKKNVEEYAAKAQYSTPIDNPYVIELLERLGFENIDDLLSSNFLTRVIE